MTPRYRDVIEGLHERFQSVIAIPTVLRYEPRTVQTTPLLYSLLDSFERTQQGQITVMRYRVLHRLVVAWQDNEQAEEAVIDLINAVCHAVDQDPQLGGRIPSGMARIVDGKSGFWQFAGAMYRVVDVYSDTLTKAPVRSGI